MTELFFFSFWLKVFGSQGGLNPANTADNTRHILNLHYFRGFLPVEKTKTENYLFLLVIYISKFLFFDISVITKVASTVLI